MRVIYYTLNSNDKSFLPVHIYIYIKVRITYIMILISVFPQIIIIFEMLDNIYNCNLYCTDFLVCMSVYVCMYVCIYICIKDGVVEMKADNLLHVQYDPQMLQAIERGPSWRCVYMYIHIHAYTHIYIHTYVIS